MAALFLSPDLDADPATSFSSDTIPDLGTIVTSSTMKHDNQESAQQSDAAANLLLLHTPMASAEALKLSHDIFQSDADSSAAEETTKRLKSGEHIEQDFTLPFDDENARQLSKSPVAKLAADKVGRETSRAGPRLAPINKARNWEPWTNSLPHIWDAINWNDPKEFLAQGQKTLALIDSIRHPETHPKNPPSHQWHYGYAQDPPTPHGPYVKWYLNQPAPTNELGKISKPSVKRRSPAETALPRNSYSRFAKPTKTGPTPVEIKHANHVAPAPEERPAKRFKTVAKSTAEQPKSVARAKQPAKAKPKKSPEAVKKRTGREVHHNAKEALLARIKGFMNARTDNLVTPKSQYKKFEDAPVLPFGDSIETKTVIRYDKDQEKASPSFGDASGLHPKEKEMAEALKITYDEYRCQKRRILLGFALFQKLIQGRSDISPSWSKTQTQAIGNVDVNKLSNLFLNFEQWGWLDATNFGEEYLDKMQAKFDIFEAVKSRATTTGPAELAPC